ncbi:hypothetical protein [Phytopseudomonas daroniae]|uniref:hypothetical protein n=1 Tax=Phytopseudomonas daroniae TaxID=2487519 RepID=UPI00103848F3|nr:hypothetical protein [Pseudomonas daroniae]
MSSPRCFGFQIADTLILPLMAAMLLHPQRSFALLRVFSICQTAAAETTGVSSLCDTGPAAASRSYLQCLQEELVCEGVHIGMLGIGSLFCHPTEALLDRYRV